MQSRTKVDNIWKLLRDIYYAKYYGKGGEWPLGKEIKQQGAGEKMKKGTEKKEENNLTEELASMIRESTAIASKAAYRAEELRSASGVSLDSLVQNLKQGAAFELPDESDGWCDRACEAGATGSLRRGKGSSRDQRRDLFGINF